MVKIDVCTLTSMANVRILEERRPTREKRKGDEVLCMTKLDALTILIINKSRNSESLKIVHLLASDTLNAPYFYYVIQTKTCMNS